MDINFIKGNPIQFNGGFVDYNTICQLKYVAGNRCYSSNTDEASELGYTPTEAKRFRSRAEKIAKKIYADGGFSPFSPLVLGHWGEDFYLIDGQGRREALRLINEEHFVPSRFKDKEPLTINQIPVIVIECPDKKDLYDAVYSINTCNTNQKQEEYMWGQALNEEDGVAVEYINKIKNLQDLYGISFRTGLLLYFPYNILVNPSLLGTKGNKIPLNKDNEIEISDDLVDFFTKLWTKTDPHKYAVYRSEKFVQGFAALFGSLRRRFPNNREYKRYLTQINESLAKVSDKRLPSFQYGGKNKTPRTNIQKLLLKRIKGEPAPGSPDEGYVNVCSCWANRERK